MISEAEIKRRLKAYLDSPKGKKQVEKASRDRLDKILSSLIPEAKEMLRSFLPVSLQDGVGIETGTISKTKSGGYKIGINLTNVWRPSLDPSSYPEGVQNIVLLFNEGYDTGGRRVRGEWKSHGSSMIWSLPERQGEHFLEDFVDAFNYLYEDVGVKAYLSSKYITRDD